MAKQGEKLFIFLIICFFALSGLARGRVYQSKGRRGVNRLFVFGDSYADTGNFDKSTGLPWKEPYGMTYPGKPAGRFSDGRILTDYIASHYGIPSPVPYELRSSIGAEKQQFGMNFAYGGTGVFNTTISKPNMTVQISFFQQQIDAKVYTKADLLTSLALVSVCGNDYVTYLKSGGSVEGVAGFTESVINQTLLDLKRIRDLGVPKIAVTALEPIGCLPAITMFSTSPSSCIDKINAIGQAHNQLLAQGVKELNEGSRQPTFFILDLYNAFSSAIQKHNQTQPDPLVPCCQGITSNYGCGDRDGNQVKYTVCKNPGLSFFWDSVHPAQYGWGGVYSELQSSLP